RSGRAVADDPAKSRRGTELDPPKEGLDLTRSEVALDCEFARDTAGHPRMGVGQKPLRRRVGLPPGHGRFPDPRHSRNTIALVATKPPPRSAPAARQRGFWNEAIAQIRIIGRDLVGYTVHCIDGEAAADLVGQIEGSQAMGFSGIYPKQRGERAHMNR